MIPYTTIPFISAIFLVFVGLLIGHLIWYRWRDEQELVAHHQERKQRQLQQILESQTIEYRKLEDESTYLRDAVQELQRERTESTLRIEQLEREYSTASSQLAQERQTRSKVSESLQEELQSRQQWQEQAIDAQRRLEV
jgi:hypothetical protein